MSLSTLDPLVKSFIYERLETYEDLEILLFLVRETQSIKTEEAANAVGCSIETAAESLSRLCQKELIEVSPAGSTDLFKYAPLNAELRDGVEKFVVAWETNRIEVIKQLSHNSLDRIRNSVIKTFADAFLIGRPKGG